VHLTSRPEGAGPQGEGCCCSVRVRPIALISAAGARFLKASAICCVMRVARTLPF
jgi:hypothetical protein